MRDRAVVGLESQPRPVVLRPAAPRMRQSPASGVPTAVGHGRPARARGDEQVRPTHRRRAPRERTAYDAVTSATSTRSMNRIESRYAVNASAVSGSTMIQVASPSSRRTRWCSTWPCGDRISASRDLAGRQRVEMLRGERVQPGEPVGAADPQDATMGAVDDPAVLDQPALLAERVAVVRRHAGVDADAGDGALPVKQRADHTSSLRARRAATFRLAAARPGQCLNGPAFRVRRRCWSSCALTRAQSDRCQRGRCFSTSLNELDLPVSFAVPSFLRRPCRADR